MSGVFDPASLPRRPGAYFRYLTEETDVVPPSTGSVVAMPITHDWGPVEVATPVNSLSHFQALFGNTVQSGGYRAVKMAFQGEGSDGAGGAGQIIVYRMVGASGAKSTRTLSNTTPAGALKLDGKYEGTKADNLRVTVQDYAADATKDELILYYGSVEVERYRYANTNVADLALQINTFSDWVTATSLITGVALTPVTTVAFTGGNDGSTLLAGDWTAAQTALEPQRFSLFVPFNLTDLSIVTTLKTWIRDMNAKGRRVFGVFGGALDESAATANTRSTTISDENIANLGVGSVRDNNMLDVAGNPVILSTAQFAPRVAGVFALRGEARSVTFAEFDGVEIVVGPTDAEVDTAFDSGTMVLGRNLAGTAVRIERGVTTYTADSAEKPKRIYSVPKNVRVIHGFETEFQEWFDENIVGEFTVGDDARDAAIAEATRRLSQRESVGVIRPGWIVRVSDVPPPDDSQDYIALDYGLLFGRSVERVFNSIRIG